MKFTLIALFSLLVAAIAQSEIPNNDVVRPILLRLFPDFGTIYRSVYPLMNEENNFGKDHPFDVYNLTFSAKEFAQISEESLTMLNAKVLKREVIFHPEPNFEVAGTRYFYRRHPKQDEPVEIELVNPQDRLFREVLEPKRFFFLSSFDNVQYIRNVPVLPYYEVSFTCEHETLKKIDEDYPAVTYQDRSLGWTARYMLDVPMFGLSTSVQLNAFADIRNRADYSFQIKQIKLAAGRFSSARRSMRLRCF